MSAIHALIDAPLSTTTLPMIKTASEELYGTAQCSRSKAGFSSLDFLADVAMEAINASAPAPAATSAFETVLSSASISTISSSGSSSSIASSKFAEPTSDNGDTVLEVKPRPRRRSFGKGGRQALGGRPHHDDSINAATPIRVTPEVLRQHFAMPLNDAARHIGICATAIKKVCRKMGIRQWPFQRLKPIERRLAKLRKSPSMQPQVTREVESLEAKKAALLLGLDIDDDTDALPQDCASAF